LTKGPFDALIGFGEGAIITRLLYFLKTFIDPEEFSELTGKMPQFYI
jgi:hypothetical protein